MRLFFRLTKPAGSWLCPEKHSLPSRLAAMAAAAASVGALLLPAAPASLSRVVEITLPQETAKLIASPLPGYALAQAMCLTCHSTDYMTMQPVSWRAYWQSSVIKMQKTFGAPIPDEAVAPLVDYLVKTYGNERTTATTPAPSKATGQRAN